MAVYVIRATDGTFLLSDPVQLKMNLRAKKIPFREYTIKNTDREGKKGLHGTLKVIKLI